MKEAELLQTISHLTKTIQIHLIRQPIFDFRFQYFGFVSLKVFDVLGNEIATLVNEEKPAGVYEVEFKNSHSGNVRNLPAGRQGLVSGIYFYQLKAIPNGGQAGEFIQTKKMILIK